MTALSRRTGSWFANARLGPDFKTAFRFGIAGLLIPLSVVLSACSLDSGPFGTPGQQAYGARLNDSMPKNPLLNLHIVGATADAKVIVYGSVGDSGPANPSQTALADRIWVIHEPPPDFLRTVVTQIKSEGVVLKKVFCAPTGNTQLVGEQYLAPFTVGVLGTLSPATFSSGHEQPESFEISTSADIPTNVPNPLTELTRPTSPSGGSLPIFEPGCPDDVIEQIQSAFE